MSTLRSLGWSSAAITGFVCFLTTSLLPAAVLGAPLVAITRPEDGALVHGQTWIDVVYRSDSEHPIVVIELYVDGERTRFMRLSVPEKEGKQAFTWDFTFAPASTHTIKAKAIDAAGNEGSASIVVEVRRLTTTNVADQIPPQVSIYYPGQGAKVSGEVAIKANATDLAGVQTVFFYLDGVFMSMIMQAPPYVTTWDTMKVDDGPHVLQAKAFDEAENVGASAEVTVIVENRSMTTAAVSPAAPVSLATADPITVPAPAPLTAVSPIPAATSVGDGTTQEQQFGGPTIAEPQPAPESAITEQPTWPKPVALPPSTAISTSPSRVEMLLAAAPPQRPGEAVSAASRISRPPVVSMPPQPEAIPGEPAVVVGEGAPTSVSEGAGTESAPMLVAAVTTAARPGPGAFAPSAAARTTAPLSSSSAWPVPVAVATDSGVAASASEVVDYRLAMLPRSLPGARADEHRVTRPPIVPVTPAAVAAVRDMKIVFDGELLDLRAVPEVKDGVSVAALREIFEHTDGILYWLHVEKEVHAVSSRVDLRLQIGNPQIQVNDETRTLVLAPYIKRGRTMVPLQFLAETLDVTIRFNPATGQIIVSSNNF